MELFDKMQLTQFGTARENSNQAINGRGLEPLSTLYMCYIAFNFLSANKMCYEQLSSGSVYSPEVNHT